MANIFFLLVFVLQMAAVSLVKFIYQWVLLNGLVEPVIAPSTTEPTFTATTALPKCSLYKDIQCRDIPAGCANCTFNSSCVYGGQTTINCTALDSIDCWVIAVNISRTLPLCNKKRLKFQQIIMHNFELPFCTPILVLHTQNLVEMCYTL